MKKVKEVAVAVTGAAMVLAACGSIVDGRVDSGEIVVPEMSSEDLLVSSLEFLLQEDGTEETSEADKSEEAKKDATSEEDDREKDTVEIQTEQERVPQEDEAVIYYGNAGSYDLKQEIVPAKEKTAEELLGALAKHNIVSLDTKLLSFEEEETNGSKVLYLDLSKAMDEYLKTMSREAECIILASVVNTFLENYDADSVYLVVNGKTLVTKNAEYTEAFVKCTPEELLKRLELPALESEGEEE